MTSAVPFLLAALMLAAAPAPKAEVGNVRFPSPRLMVVKAKSGSSVYVRGPLRVDMSFKKAMVRKPLLKVTCLCAVDGRLTCCSGMWDRLKTNSRLSRSEIMKAYKAAGEEPKDSKERTAAYSDPQRISALLSEVTRDAYAGASYGDASMNGGLFRLGSCAALPKLLLYRFEVWQNGVLVGSYESSHTGLGNYDIPVDWHVWKKHPQKFSYVDSF